MTGTTGRNQLGKPEETIDAHCAVIAAVVVVEVNTFIDPRRGHRLPRQTFPPRFRH